MKSRRQFLRKGSLGFLSSLMLPRTAAAEDAPDSKGMVLQQDEGESFRLRDGTAILTIKIARVHGSETAFLYESYKPGDQSPIHKHMNEDELIFFHRGTGWFMLDEKEYQVKEGSVVLVPKGMWHGWRNTGTEDIHMCINFTPSGLEGCFREMGTPVGQPFVQRTYEERKAIAKKWGTIFRD